MAAGCGEDLVVVAREETVGMRSNKVRRMFIAKSFFWRWDEISIYSPTGSKYARMANGKDSLFDVIPNYPTISEAFYEICQLVKIIFLNCFAKIFGK